MADYKELIRKAIQALPENNGAARRAVYEKARAALVGQLRGLNPPLAARDITQHRLQLEDCIRQVEQEASEAVIAGLKQNEDFPGGGPAGLPPPRQPAAARAASNGTTRPLALPNGGRAPLAPATRSTASPPPRPSTISTTARPAASPAAANRASARPAAPVAVPRAGTGAPKNAPPMVVAPNRSQTGTRPNGRVAAAPPRALSRREDEPETIEDIIAAAENGAEPIDFDIEQPPEAIDDQPQPPMFRLEQRQSRKPAGGQRGPERHRNGEAQHHGEDQRDGEDQRGADSRPLPAIVARAEAAKAARSAPRQVEAPRRANGSSNGYRSELGPPARQQLTSRQQPAEPIRLPRLGNAAMSSVREVDLEAANEGDPQIAIERAIATLEREARNDGEGGGDEEFEDRAPVNGRRRNGLDGNHRDAAANADQGFARAPVENERGGGSAVTIFLLVFLVLLVAAGGGGFWAWHEGFIDFDAMFGKSPVVAQATVPVTTAPQAAVASTAPLGPQTNTEPAPSTAAQSAQPLSAAPDAPAIAPSAEPSAQNGVAKSEARLGQSTDAPGTPTTPATAQPPGAATASAGGSQSLLLEASQDGTTGAVPFSGTVDWSEGKDEMGQPTLVGKASIPARNLGVSVLIRKNNDPALPASHLMEINFTVTDSFIGGAISGLPGVLLKNEELVQGTPLVGASARVVGNSFLFALSSSAADEATNKDLLTSRKWIDLAIIYATGKKAIITLEKDDKAEQMFTEVFAAWDKEAAAATPAAAAKSP